MDETTNLLSPQDVRRMLGISRTKAAQILKTEIPTYRIGKVIRVKRADFEAFLTRCRQEPGSSASLGRTSSGGCSKTKLDEEHGSKL